jgi:hypothetical protein
MKRYSALRTKPGVKNREGDGMSACFISPLAPELNEPPDGVIWQRRENLLLFLEPTQFDGPLQDSLDLAPVQEHFEATQMGVDGYGLVAPALGLEFLNPADGGGLESRSGRVGPFDYWQESFEAELVPC